MRTIGLLAILPLLGTGCAGTMLSQLETGYGYAPNGGDGNAGDGLHAASLAGHIGGSSVPGVGIGATVRTRAWTDGWAFPEFGPHGFVMLENDGPVAFYSRLSLTGGLSGVGGDIGPIFTASLTPGIVVYPADEPVGLTVAAEVAAHAAPAADDTQVWFGVRIGIAIGGVSD